MSPLGIASSLFSLVSSVRSDGTASSRANGAGKNGNGDFASSLALQMAQMQSQNPFLGGANGTGSSSGNFDFLLGNAGQQGGTSDPLGLAGMMRGGSASSALAGLSPLGRNLSLFDPESGYRMMSEINSRDVSYKAQFAELSEMKVEVADMQRAGLALGNLGSAADSGEIKSRLQAFVGEYNEWVGRFDGSVAKGGVLAGTQAAEVSLYELKQSIENRFNGAAQGFNGLADLGVTIDPTTHLASFDAAKFDTALAASKGGVVSTINQFAANFTRSAELLNSENNFIPNRLANLDRVIDYIGDHKTALQAEFGTGDAAKPSGQVARALAAYQKMVGAA